MSEACQSDPVRARGSLSIVRPTEASTGSRTCGCGTRADRFDWLVINGFRFRQASLLSFLFAVRVRRNVPGSGKQLRSATRLWRVALHPHHQLVAYNRARRQAQEAFAGRSRRTSP